METNKIGGTVLGLLDSLGLSDAKRCALIISNWESIAGDGLKEFVKPESYRYGILELSVTSHAWAQELQLLKPKFIDKVNRSIGKDIVEDIRFRVRGKEG